MSGNSAVRHSSSNTLRAGFALATVMVALAAVELTPHVQRLFEPINLALARATELALASLDMPVSRSGAVLAHPDGFSYRITYVCSGVRPAILIGVALLAVPASWRARVAGFAAALVVLEALNLCRLVHLYWTGVANPEAYVFAHRVAWNAVFVAAVAGLLAIWLVVAARERRRTSANRPITHVHA